MKGSNVINETEWYKLFSSDEFLRKLKVAGNYAASSEIEACFLGYRGNDGKFYFSAVNEGDEDSCSNPDHDDSNQYRILDFHFHTRKGRGNRPIRPSYDDLCLANSDDLVLGCILGVGQVKEDKAVDILLLQKTHRLSLTDISKLFDEIEAGNRGEDYFCSTHEVTRYFEDSGHYKSEVITFRLDRGLYVPSFSASSFRKFSFRLRT